MRHCAKYGRNRSNGNPDMAIFRFFKMAAAAILYFWNFKFLTVEAVKRVELRHSVKFRRNRSNPGRCSSFDNMNVFRFREFGLKTPIHAPKLGFGGFWSPKWGAMWTNFKKAHPCASPKKTQGRQHTSSCACPLPLNMGMWFPSSTHCHLNEQWWLLLYSPCSVFTLAALCWWAK